MLSSVIKVEIRNLRNYKTALGDHFKKRQALGKNRKVAYIRSPNYLR